MAQNFSSKHRPTPSAMILGVGSFAHSIGKALADAGREGLDLSHAQLRPFPAVAGRTKHFRATPFRVRFR
jgi:hypothetical protein